MSDNRSLEETIKEVAKATESDAITSLVCMRSKKQHSKDISMSLPTSSKENDNKLDTSESVSVGDKLIGEPILPKPIFATEMSTTNLKTPMTETQNTLSSSKTTFNNSTLSFEGSKSDFATKKANSDGTFLTYKSNMSLENAGTAHDIDYDNALNSLLGNFLNMTESKYRHGSSKLEHKRILMQHLVVKIKQDITDTDISSTSNQRNDESPQDDTNFKHGKESDIEKEVNEKNPTFVQDVEKPVTIKL